MKNLFLLVAMCFSFFGFSSEDEWGRTGHRATGEIADQYLSKKAKKQIDRILRGHSLAMVSTYGDDIKSDPQYRQYGPWHYVNLEEGQRVYTVEAANPAGDLVQGIEKSIEVLKDRNASREEKEFYLKMLVHFLGDLHQPFHAGRGEDKGGNDILVRWFGKDSNIHRVWDSEMINDYQMSYTELAKNTDRLTAKEVREISSGTVLDWMYESKELSGRVYDSVEVGDRLGYEYMYEWFPVVRQQLQKGGIRLAQVLNDIFG